MNKVKFYGHELSDESVKIDTAKVSAINNMQIPKPKTELLRFL